MSNLVVKPLVCYAGAPYLLLIALGHSRRYSRFGVGITGWKHYRRTETQVARATIRRAATTDPLSWGHVSSDKF